MLTNELKTKITDILEEECSKDKTSGFFYSEIYTDYNDELSSKSILEICQAKNPHESFDEKIMEMYEDYEFNLKIELLDKILKDENIANAINSKETTENEIQDFIYDHHYTKLPYEHYLNQDIYVNIILNTGDLNSDFTINQPFASWDGKDDKIIDNDAAILWLSRQQGYKKSELTNAIRNQKFGKSRFLASLYQEIANCTSHMNCLTFMIQMSLKQWLELYDAIEKEKKLNDRYFPRRSKGRGFMIIDKLTTCGLYSPWQGAGGCLEIALEKDVKIPFRYVESIYPDGGRGYSIYEIFGICHSAWSPNGIKEIHAMKKAA